MRRALNVLALCATAGVVCAFAFLLSLWWNLPPSDAARQASPIAIFADPFFVSGAVLAGVSVGFIAFPFVYFAIRNRRLDTTAVFIVLIVLAEIVAVTPFSRRIGLVGAPIALGVALLTARYSRLKVFGPAEATEPPPASADR